MRLIKEISFATALTLASLYSIATSQAQEIHTGSLTIDHPWSRQSPMAANVAAGFMKITNAGTEDDTLVKATASISGNVQLHDMKMENDVMKMFEVEGGIVIPAGQTVELKPRSLHIMFMDVTAQPKEGETFTGTLVFEKAGVVTVDFEVMGPMAGMN
ncbi:MAG: copper chaperone PCu(A)C [Alphaproteobacteria bacterium]|nr:copper chaperone PCu(A)C [Alphaproteobacteria bacterium]